MGLHFTQSENKESSEFDTGTSEIRANKGAGASDPSESSVDQSHSSFSETTPKGDQVDP